MLIFELGSKVMVDNVLKLSMSFKRYKYFVLEVSFMLCDLLSFKKNYLCSYCFSFLFIWYFMHLPSLCESPNFLSFTSGEINISW
jgi:hypothetical protein